MIQSKNKPNFAHQKRKFGTSICAAHVQSYNLVLKWLKFSIWYQSEWNVPIPSKTEVKSEKSATNQKNQMEKLDKIEKSVPIS
jgi:hypothetical protein